MLYRSAEVPRNWRLQESYRGDEKGRLIGSVCPKCGAKHFPSREGTVCPECGWELTPGNVPISGFSKILRGDWELTSDSNPEIRQGLGVGTLLLTKVNGVLNLILFEEICDLLNDQDSKKLEKIVTSDLHDKFSRPKGLNTVTGKVDIEANDKEIEQFWQTVASNPQSIAILTEAMQREVLEEAGISLPKESFHFLTSSELIIEQFRGEYSKEGQPVINRFLIHAFATLLSQEELALLMSNSERAIKLIPIDQLEKTLQQAEIRKATRAILDFLNATLLFIARTNDQQLEELLFPIEPQLQNWEAEQSSSQTELAKVTYAQKS